MIIIKTKEINARLSTIKNKINFFREKFSSSSESSDLSLTPIKEYNIRFNHMRMNDFITITESAQKYLAKLVSEKEDGIYNVRVLFPTLAHLEQKLVLLSVKLARKNQMTSN